MALYNPTLNIRESDGSPSGYPFQFKFSNGVITDNGDGTFSYAAPTTSPGGSDTQVQFNDGGAFGGDSGFTFNKTTNIATLSGGITLSNLTAGSVLFAGTAGVVSQDNANLFWDDANNRLGVVTSSPGTTLDVAGTLRVRGTAVNDALTVNSSAQVGIAVAVGSIAFGFDCRAQANFASDILLNSGAGVQTISGSVYSVRGGGGYDMDFGANGSTGFLKVQAAGNIIINDSGSSAAYVRIEGDTDANLFYTDAVNDKVGVGTAAPNSKLDVVGTVQCDGFRIDVSPTAETITPTHTITISVNGTNYKIPIVAA